MVIYGFYLFLGVFDALSGTAYLPSFLGLFRRLKQVVSE
jgi:hypothetical protein